LHPCKRQERKETSVMHLRGKKKSITQSLKEKSPSALMAPAIKGPYFFRPEEKKSLADSKRGKTCARWEEEG